MKLKGILCRTLEGHGHWVNTLALSSDYIVRTGAFDPKNASLVQSDMDLTSIQLNFHFFFFSFFKSNLSFKI